MDRTRVEYLINELQKELKIYEQIPHDHIKETPKRITKMLIDEVFSSLYQSPPEITTFPNKDESNQVIIIKNLEVRSMCAHHWMPFYGFANIAYIPDKFVAGLSKFGRVVDYFSRKPQIQEVLAKEIVTYLDSMLKPQAIGIYISCTHMCMRHRGLESDHSVTDNIYIKGINEEVKMDVKNSLLQLIRG